MNVNWNKPWSGKDSEIGKLIKPFKKLIPKKKKKKAKK